LLPALAFGAFALEYVAAVGSVDVTAVRASGLVHGFVYRSHYPR